MNLTEFVEFTREQFSAELRLHEEDKGKASWDRCTILGCHERAMLAGLIHYMKGEKER